MMNVAMMQNSAAVEPHRSRLRISPSCSAIYKKPDSVVSGRLEEIPGSAFLLDSVQPILFASQRHSGSSGWHRYCRQAPSRRVQTMSAAISELENPQAHLLVVDDEPEIRNVLHELLSGSYQCVVVASAEEALALL